MDNVIHQVPLTGNSWNMYGVVAAQRRAAGNVWLVVSGLAGPATCALARIVKDITEELPWSKGHHSKVLWVPVKVEVTAGKASPQDGDVRRINGSDFYGPVRFWPPEV